MTASNLAKLKSSNPKLIYFDTKGRGEPIRIILARKGIDFEDIRLNLEMFDTLKSDTTFLGNNKLIWIDEHGIEQSEASATKRMIELK